MADKHFVQESYKKRGKSWMRDESGVQWCGMGGEELETGVRKSGV